MNDLTVIYITANEMPDAWMEYQINCLYKAIGNTPVISVSKKRINLGLNILDDQEEKSYWNIYRQLLRGTKLAKTDYVAMAEDDALYSRQHFVEFRPKKNEVSYNRARWSLFSWQPEFYCLRQRVSNCSLIAPRDYLIEALEEREAKYPEGHDYAGEVGRPIVERNLGVKPRNKVEWYSTVPIIHLNHPAGIDDTQKRQWKKRGQLKAHDIPHWGKAVDIIKEYNRG